MWYVLTFFTLFASVWGKGTFAHITDLHYDPQYKVGVSTLGYCRTADVGTSGRFGTPSNRCDSPRSLIKDSLVWIATFSPKVDFVLVTGDFARRSRDNEVRNQTDQMSEIAEASKLLADLVAEPQIVLPSIGGSDLWPEGDCSVSDPQFAQLQVIWEPFLKPWLTDKTAQDDFLNYGCYHVDLVQKGFGVIMLNTEFWSFSNGAAGPETCDEGKGGHMVFVWMEKVLESYKAQNKKVLIAGNRKYYDEYGELDGYRAKCMARYVNMTVVYEETILGHVFGGGHEDSFNLIVNNVDFRKKNITGVVHVSPGIVPVKNPAIRIYEYASINSGVPPGTLTNYEQYYADIVQANLAAEITFKLEYDALATYGLDDFSTNSWLNLYTRLDADPVLRHKYEFYKAVSSEAVEPPLPPEGEKLIGVVFSVVCGIFVLLAGGLAWYKCRSFKHKTYEQELAEGLR